MKSRISSWYWRGLMGPKFVCGQFPIVLSKGQPYDSMKPRLFIRPGVGITMGVSSGVPTDTAIFMRILHRKGTERIPRRFPPIAFGFPRVRL